MRLSLFFRPPFSSHFFRPPFGYKDDRRSSSLNSQPWPAIMAASIWENWPFEKGRAEHWGRRWWREDVRTPIPHVRCENVYHAAVSSGRFSHSYVQMHTYRHTHTHEHTILHISTKVVFCQSGYLSGEMSVKVNVKV